MDFDERIFEADLAVDRAHVIMLAEQSIIADADVGEILAALEAVETAGFDALPNAEDVHEAIETAVIDRIGPVGGKLHTARSRNDEVATCLRYRLREDLLAAVDATVLARRALCTIAETETETLMPGYTHLQPAQPTTVAHWALSYESTLRRDTARLIDAFDRANRSPLGAAAFAGTPYAIDRERTATLLGFDGIVENAMDAAAARDFLVESAAAHAGLATTLSGLAADVILFANRGFVTLDDAYASTSSIMPQKVNPDTLELVRATAGTATGGVQALLTTLKGLPRAYNRDLQAASPGAWVVFDAVTEATEVAAGAVTTATWERDRLAAAAADGFTTATDVADLLAMAGVPFRTAHEIVSTAADVADDRESLATAVYEAASGHLEEYEDASLDEATLLAVLDPAGSVRRRDSTGGPAPTAVLAALERANEAIEADAAVAADRSDAIADAAAARDAEVARRA